MTKEEELSKYMALIEYYKEQLSSLDAQLNYLQAAVADYHKAKMTLEQLSKSDDGAEMLLPIGGGVFINANAKDTTNVLLDVGGGIVIEKKFDDAIKKIDKRIENLQEIQERLSSMMQQIQSEAAEASDKASETGFRRKIIILGLEKMFKFLRKKLKRFEDKLEAELKSELEKEEEKIEKEEPKPEAPPKKIVTPEPTIEKKPIEEKPFVKKESPKPEEKEPVEEELEKVVKKPERLRKRLFKKKISEEKLKRDEQVDKQIEASIETELKHALRTKRSLEEIAKVDRKPSRGISESKLDELLWDLEVGLLESDVAYSVIESIKQDIKEELRHVSFARSNVSELVENVLRNAIVHVLKASETDFNEFIDKRKKPVVIMFVGVNGSGKTLCIAKIAHLLKKQGKSCVMAAGDTFRAGAIEQLEVHADSLGVKLIKHGPGADPAAVAFDAIEHAKAKHKDVVLLDTAGRMQTNINLMDEMAKIKRVAKPDLILFVGDALAGNDAVEQAKRFNEVVGVDGVILTKVDTDAKGGSALSVAYTIGKPLLFIGIGQKYEDQIPFDPQWMIENIFGAAS